MRTPDEFDHDDRCPICDGHGFTVTYLEDGTEVQEACGCESGQWWAGGRTVVVPAAQP